ncbi:hypothetical protein EXU85_20565 [Spirosoma sp. KCTC 42546]|uniref:hypothetical protein n=1 Tax=Spirosoma sp. KCTC 42546 TaxID=2520506 RepID=UPI00115A0E2A|nr:hypothetical protein [Spirosoma sp. KCTC 42546]QDK80874.1 hypothetical protein EXU85_20565 [Spirosoma sp. KCTC 42546]
MPTSVAPPLKYPTIADWKAAVNACRNADQLNVLVRDLKVGKAGGTIHRFWENNQMALARWLINERAKKLKLTFMSDQTFRDPVQ